MTLQISPALQVACIVELTYVLAVFCRSCYYHLPPKLPAKNSQEERFYAERDFTHVHPAWANPLVPEMALRPLEKAHTECLVHAAAAAHFDALNPEYLR